ncbi:MAG: minor capsid protein [Lachnospiraceae bacterium]|nr:minor capsid protein [Lachnospiraceae bacterium]
MNQAYHSELAAGIEKKYRMLEEEIMKDVVRRIRKARQITSTADYQIQRYLILGHSTEDVERIIRQAVGNDWPETFQMYDKVIEWEYVRSRRLYEQVNAYFLPYEQNAELQQLTRALVQQSNDELFNISHSLGFMVNMGNGRRVFSPLSEIYNGYLDNAIMMMASGAFDYNTLIRKVVGEMTASGLRTVDYADGHSNRVDVAARRALLTGMGQLTGHISDMNGQKLGTDRYEVDWHPGARPDHAVWQGRVWTRQQLVEVCGLGSGGGLLGWNCRHTYYPFLEGLSVRNYSDQWLRAMDQKEARKIAFRGKEYNLYEATQKQRQMETAMRAQREKARLLKQGDADPDDVLNARCKYQAMLDEYKAFSKKFGLPEQRERIYADLRGRVAPSKRTYEKWQAKKMASRKLSTDKVLIVDTSDRNRVLSKLKESEKEITDSTVENAVIILRDGRIRRCKGDLNGVLIDVDSPGGLKGAYVTHNHPSGSDHEYSFSNEDIQFFMDHDLEVLRGIDELYEYELTRNAGELDAHMTLEELFLSEGKDARHEEVIEIARRYGIGYRRKRR